MGGTNRFVNVTHQPAFWSTQLSANNQAVNSPDFTAKWKTIGSTVRSAK